MAANKWILKQGDTHPPQVVALRYDDDTPIDLTGSTVRFMMIAASGTVVADRNVTVSNPSAGEVTIDWQAQETAEAGFYTAEFEITTSMGKKQRVPGDRYITVEILPRLVE